MTNGVTCVRRDTECRDLMFCISAVKPHEEMEHFWFCGSSSSGQTDPFENLVKAMEFAPQKRAKITPLTNFRGSLTRNLVHRLQVDNRSSVPNANCEMFIPASAPLGRRQTRCFSLVLIVSIYGIWTFLLSIVGAFVKLLCPFI